MTPLFFLIASCFLAGVLFDIALLHFLGYLCLALYAWNRWQVPRALGRIEASRSLHSHAFLGDEVEVNLTIKNLGRLALPWLSVPPARTHSRRMGRPR